MRVAILACLALILAFSQPALSVFGPGFLEPSLYGFPASFLEPSAPLALPQAIFLPDSAFMPDIMGGIFDMPEMGDLYGSFIESPAGFQGLGMQDVLPYATGTYTEDDNGKTVKVKPGDTIRIRLQAQVDEGYSWNLSATPGLNVTGQRMYPPEVAGMDPFTGTVRLLADQEWEVLAVEPGAQAINARYQQSQPGGPHDRTYTLTVIVE